MLATPVILILAVALTSALSGVLGMGGGILLMGVCTLLVPASAAMVVHGTAQLTANGARALIHRKQIAWRVLAPYAVGTSVGLAAFATLGIMTETWIIQLALGALPFLGQVTKRAPRLTIEKPGQSLLCGVAVTGIQLLAGASGPLLDLFFVDTRLTRHEVVATKALTQSLGHAVKLVYYGGLLNLGDSPSTPGIQDVLATLPSPELLLPGLVLTSVLGTAVGSRVLDRLSDEKFRHWSRRLIMAVGASYLLQGIVGCAAKFLGP